MIFLLAGLEFFHEQVDSCGTKYCPTCKSIIKGFVIGALVMWVIYYCAYLKKGTNLLLFIAVFYPFLVFLELAYAACANSNEIWVYSGLCPASVLLGLLHFSPKG